MSRYRVQVTEVYADGADQPWSVARQVTDAVGAACHHPIEVHANGTRRQIACGERLPADQQCDACRTHVHVVKVRRVTG
ncbi:hypothetical protein GCM10022419_045300 [Nonomuraea rosea]|uniref:DUF3039 domain-containing protein n=1 Tax=Nonomuraea rosea TaxID=638574 RepID=A0ABP6X379_9ACTN